MLNLIKYFTIVFFAYLVRLKLGEVKKLDVLKIIGYTVIPALLLTWLSLYIIEPFNSIIIAAVLSGAIAIIEKLEFRREIFYIGISYAVSHILYAVSVFMASVLSVILFRTPKVNVFNSLFVFIFQAILILIIYRVKKFKITIDYSKNIAGTGTAISGILLILYGIIRTDGNTTTDFILPFTGVIFCGLGLYWWVKKESVDTYNEKLQKLKNKKQQEEIEQSNILRLELEKTLHTENKRLPAYREVLENMVSHIENETVRQKSVNILKEFNASVMTEFSKEITWEADRKALPETGIALVDVIFDYYSKIAERHGIDFSLETDGKVSQITEIITQSQLETLVSNLLDNAIIAVKKSENKSEKYIKVSLRERGLCVEDNGAAFSKSVLADLKRCKETLIPNEENGGGIGFVTIFEIANTCNASVEIMQNSENNKSVTIRFDGENRVVADGEY